MVSDSFVDHVVVASTVSELKPGDLFIFDGNRDFVFEHVSWADGFRGRAERHEIKAASVEGSRSWRALTADTYSVGDAIVFIVKPKPEPEEPEYIIEQKYICRTFGYETVYDPNLTDIAVGEFITEQVNLGYELITLTRSNRAITVLLNISEKVYL